MTQIGAPRPNQPKQIQPAGSNCLLMAKDDGDRRGGVARCLPILGTPLPWMLGALFATMIASMCGVHLYIHQMVRRIWIIVLGLTLGSNFTPDVLDHVSICGCLALPAWWSFVLFGTWLCYQIFVRFGRLDRVTAFFCASPGGLGEMIILGPALGGDERSIVLMHATRVVLVMAIIPPAYSILAGYVPPMLIGSTTFFWDVPLRDLGIFAATGLVGAVVAKLAQGCPPGR